MNRLDQNTAKEKFYHYFSVAFVAIMAFLFAFPLYWIITGAFKPVQRSMRHPLSGSPLSGIWATSNA